MAERYIPEHRRTQYKARGLFKPEELRRRREDQQVEIRKTKREENLAKRRGIADKDGNVQVGGAGAGFGAAPDSEDEGVSIEVQVGVSSSPCDNVLRVKCSVSPERVDDMVCVTPSS